MTGDDSKKLSNMLKFFITRLYVHCTHNIIHSHTTIIEYVTIMTFLYL